MVAQDATSRIAVFAKLRPTCDPGGMATSTLERRVSVKARFRQRFLGRIDARGTEAGLCVRGAVTDDHWARHLRGTETLGVYPVTDDNLTRWSALEVDVLCERHPEAMPKDRAAELLWAVREDLRARGITTFTEVSRSGGFHEWAFFAQPVEAWRARRMWAEVWARCADGEELPEVFPKQDRLAAGMVGNYLLLPFYGPCKDGRRAITDGGRKLTVEEFLDAADAGEITPEQLTAALEDPKEPARRTASGDGSRPGDALPCLLRFLEDGPVPDKRNITCFRAGCHLHRLRLTDQDALERVQEANALLSDPLPEGELVAAVRSAFEGRGGEGYTAAGCEDEVWAQAYCVGRAACPLHATRVLATLPVEPEALRDEPTDAERRILAFPRTDAGNAEALAHFYGYRLRYDHKRGRWLVFGKHHWQPDCDGELIRLCKGLARLRHAAALKIGDKAEREAACSWARSTESRAKIDAALTLARAEPPIADKGESWDADPFLLGVPNGVIDLRTATVRDGRPEDRITQVAAVPFDPDATCPRWERFLREVLSDDEELVAFVHRALGYSVTGDMRERCFLILWGGGSNGKSVLLAQVRNALGDLAADTPFTTFELSARSGIPADLAALEGRRFVTASETAEHCRLNEARLKSWTGQDPCTARLLHENWRTFQPIGKLWLCTNHRPRVEDDSEGFWQRVRLVPFRRQFRPEDDPDLQDTLKAEAPGILRWLVEGACSWLATGLRAPASVLAASEEWRTEADPLAEFLVARCELRADLSTRSSALYAAYLAWAETEGLRDRERLTANAFGRRMGARFGARRTKTGKLYDGVRVTE